MPFAIDLHSNRCYTLSRRILMDYQLESSVGGFKAPLHQSCIENLYIDIYLFSLLFYSSCLIGSLCLFACFSISFATCSFAFLSHNDSVKRNRLSSISIYYIHAPFAINTLYCFIHFLMKQFSIEFFFLYSLFYSFLFFDHFIFLYYVYDEG